MSINAATLSPHYGNGAESHVYVILKSMDGHVSLKVLL